MPHECMTWYDLKLNCLHFLFNFGDFQKPCWVIMNKNLHFHICLHIIDSAYEGFKRTLKNCNFK